MADSAFSARKSIREHVHEKLAGIDLPTTGERQYSHDAAAQWIKTARLHLKETYNPDAGGTGMETLLDEGSRLSKIKSTDSETATTVLRRCKKDAEAAMAKAKTKKGEAAKEIQPLITKRDDAITEADRLNTSTQATIGAKEGATSAIKGTFGAAVTDAVLRSPDGKDLKGINGYTLAELVEAINLNATQPQSAETLEAVAIFLQTAFDFRRSVHRNLEVLLAEVARLSTFGVNIDPTQIALVVIVNIERAAKEPWGRTFRDVIAHIRRNYAYDHRDDATSLADILKQCREADDGRDVSDAPGPEGQGALKGAANAASDAMSYLDRLIREEQELYAYETSDDEESETAAAVTSGSDSSDDAHSKAKKKKTKSKKKKKKESRGRDERKSRGRESSGRRGRSQSAKHNPCKHCRKYHCRVQHPHVPEDKCFWNKKWKGYRPRSVADELGLPFKPREKFPPELGGYPPYSDDLASSESE